jgi:hypothetical protein
MVIDEPPPLFGSARFQCFSGLQRVKGIEALPQARQGARKRSANSGLTIPTVGQDGRIMIQSDPATSNRTISTPKVSAKMQTRAIIHNHLWYFRLILEAP